MAKKKIKIEIPEQGISESLTPEEADEFFLKEIEFYREMEPILGSQLTFGNHGIPGNAAVARKAIEVVTAARQGLGQNNYQAIDAFIQSARNYTLVVGQGHIGQHVRELVNSNQQSQAHWLLAMFSYRGQNNAWMDPFRVIATGSPAMLAFSDLSSSSSALEQSNQALAQISMAKKTLEGFIAKKTALFEDLEELYREKLVIDEPAVSWQKVSHSKTLAWRLWLIIFACLVGLPILAIMIYWSDFSIAVTKLASGANGSFSIAGVAAISVPALLYAWLLKNVSRVFIQNLNLADDAAHRRSLAVTYLGLAENPKTRIPETERAIILNALFRPIPPHSGDDGPPAGLVDLIRRE